MTIDDKIRDKKNLVITREAAKISVLSSGKICMSYVQGNINF